MESLKNWSPVMVLGLERPSVIVLMSTAAWGKFLANKGAELIRAAGLGFQQSFQSRPRSVKCLFFE